MSSDKNIVPVISGIVVATLWSLIFVYVGHSIGAESVKREAVLKGFAEYKSSKSGKAVWQWKNVIPVGPEVVE